LHLQSLAGYITLQKQVAAKNGRFVSQLFASGNPTHRRISKEKT
jgi:hypothetical protein